MKQWQSSKFKIACQEEARKKCEDRALHRRDKHKVSFYSAEVYQKQSQMEVNDIPDSTEFTQVLADSKECAEVNDDEDETPETVEGSEAFEGTKLQEIDEIDVLVERLFDFIFQNTSKEITSFQEQYST